MGVLSWWTVSALTRVIFVFIPKLRSDEGNKYKNNAQVSTETVRQESTYIVLFLTWHIESINEDKNDDLNKSSPCLTHSNFVLLMASQSIAGDIIINETIVTWSRE